MHDTSKKKHVIIVGKNSGKNNINNNSKRLAQILFMKLRRFFQFLFTVGRLETPNHERYTGTVLNKVRNWLNDKKFVKIL